VPVSADVCDADSEMKILSFGVLVTYVTACLCGLDFLENGLFIFWLLFLAGVN